MKWNLVVVDKSGIPVKIYVNNDGSRAIVFPAFGRYQSYTSDKSALDLAIQILFHVGVTSNVSTYSQYMGSMEDTAVILREAA